MKTKSIHSPLASILLGVGTAVIVCAVLIAVISKLIISQTVGEDSTGILATLILMVASMTGTWFSLIFQKNNVLGTTLLTISGMLVLVIIGALATSGSFCDVPLRLAGVIAGGVFAYVVCMKMESKSYKRKRRYR